MVKQIVPIYSWDPDSGIATCVIIDGNNTYVGTAKCRPGDRDMMGEKTGCTIAEMRAELQYLKAIRDNEIKPTLKAYKSLYYSINQSKRFNPDSYEVHMLQKKIGESETDLEMINHMINQARADLKTYMSQKEDAWKKIRWHREQDKNK